MGTRKKVNTRHRKSSLLTQGRWAVGVGYSVIVSCVLLSVAALEHMPRPVIVALGIFTVIDAAVSVYFLAQWRENLSQSHAEPRTGDNPTPRIQLRSTRRERKHR